MRLVALDPRTIVGQITGLVVLSVTFAFLLSIGALLFFISSTRDEDRGPPPQLQFTVAELARTAADEQELAVIVKNAQRIGVPVRWLRGAAAEQAIKDSRASANIGPAGPPFERRGLQGNLLVNPAGQVILRLDKSGVLVLPDSFHGRPPVAEFFVMPLLSALAVIAVCVLGLSIYAARFITAPLSSFARAAYAVGRSSNEDHKVSERGPSEIVRVARALNEMRKRIHDLLNERTNMLTAISHDLRTPLTRMKLRAEKLSSEENHSTTANGMLLDITRMEQMLGETLTYLRDDSKAESAIAVDLPSILQTICAELADLGEAINYEGPPRLVYYCKPSALTRAISNVVDNAVKFGTTISVSLSSCLDGRLRLDVADDGPGIPYPHRGRVFEPFFKSDSSRRSGGEGFGLGLSIAKRIVEDHGGSIELLDSVPRGLRVRIFLPPNVPRPNSEISQPSSSLQDRYRNF
jgi:signal transduction histidine kinase